MSQENNLEIVLTDNQPFYTGIFEHSYWYDSLRIVHFLSFWPTQKSQKMHL